MLLRKIMITATAALLGVAALQSNAMAAGHMGGGAHFGGGFAGDHFGGAHVGGFSAGQFGNAGAGVHIGQVGPRFEGGRVAHRWGYAPYAGFAAVPFAWDYAYSPDWAGAPSCGYQLRPYHTRTGWHRHWVYLCA